LQDRSAAKAVSLADVARRAGISPSTVSRFFNRPGLVSARTRARVEDAVKALGYLPDGAARTLASRRSRIVGAIVPTLDHALFAKALDSLEQHLARDGYTLIVASCGFDPGHEARQVRTLLSQRIDGLMLVGLERDPATYALLRAKGVPYVTTWVTDAPGGHPGIGIDNAEASRRIADYLLDLGHRDFAMISAPTAHNDRARQRLDGVRRALGERGLDLAPERSVERPFDLAEGRHAFQYFMQLRPRPTAVVCGADIFAIGALFEARRMGIAVPGEVSVTGFDDTDMAAQIDPQLTTVHVPVAELGRRAGNYLLGRVSGRPVADRTLLDVDLVVRDSTAPPPRS
jgi:LacI family transcriptional regulator